MRFRHLQTVSPQRKASKRGFLLAMVCLGITWAGCTEPTGVILDTSNAEQVYARALKEGWNPQRLQVIDLGIRDATITVEVAGKGSGMQLGLMHRSQLDESAGMWFEYEDEDYLSFWMLNTRIPLSIAFVRTDGTISNIEDMVPFDRSAVKSKYRCRYALEMNRGWFTKHGIQSGDLIKLGLVRANPAAGEGMR